MTRFKNILKWQEGTSYVTPNSKNVNLYAELYKDVSPGNLYNDKYVSEFFEHDVLPRYIRENPNATERQINRVRNAYGSYPQWIIKNLSNVEMGGFTHPLLHFIAYEPTSSGGVDRDAMIHENTHAYRHSSPLTTMISRDEKHYLDNAYSNKNYKVAGINISPHLHDTQEKLASNAEMRYLFWTFLYRNLGRRPTIEELDDYILNMDDHDFARWLERMSYSYSKDTIQSVVDDPEEIWKEKLDNIRDALIHVADNNQSVDMTNIARNGMKITRFKSKLHK